MKTKTASVRLPKEMFEEIDSICEKNGTCRNDFIKNAIDNQLELEANVEDESDDQEPKPVPKVIIDLNAEPKPNLTLGTIKTMNNSKGVPTKYKLISINDSGVQLWNEI